MISNFQKAHILKILSLLEIHKARPLDLILNKYFRANKTLGSKERKKVAEVIYGMVRWRGRLDAELDIDPSWESRLALLESLDWDLSNGKVPLEDHEKVSFPKELFDKLVASLGKEKALAFCKATNEPGPTTVRVNLLKTTREALFHGWKERYDVSLCKESDRGITFHEKINFTTLTEFQKGLFEIQDEASQLVSYMVGAKPGDSVLDFCAGAGGKTLGFADRLQKKGQIYLYDVREKSLASAKLRLKRAGIQNAQIVTTVKDLARLKNRMHWIIIDVPCSGSGTWRRNPDQKWKFTEEMLQGLIKTQQEIMREALAYLHPQGSLVYATCSVFPEENEEQVALFLSTYGLKEQSSFKSFPKPKGMDGFFASVLTRS